jgi:hypothetical protein
MNTSFDPKKQARSMTPGIMSRKLQRELFRAHEFVFRRLHGMSIEVVAMLYHVPLERWVAALMREKAPDEQLQACFALFLRQAERDQAEWRRHNGRITMRVVNGKVSSTWSAPA